MTELEKSGKNKVPVLGVGKVLDALLALLSGSAERDTLAKRYRPFVAERYREEYERKRRRKAAPPSEHEQVDDDFADLERELGLKPGGNASSSHVGTAGGFTSGTVFKKPRRKTYDLVSGEGKKPRGDY